jgi:hypothetical protein
MKYLTITFAALLGCGQSHAALLDSARADSLARAYQDSVNRAQPGYTVDSILPIEEQLRRFRVGLSAAPSGLEGGANDRDAVVKALLRGLETGDAALLGRLTISRAEFAYLVYPESPYSAGPYQQAPDVVWLRRSAASATGLRRLLERLGGSPIELRSVRCGEEPVTEGSNRIWNECLVRLARAGDEMSLELFAGIIERAGHFKILSYANAF